VDGKPIFNSPTTIPVRQDVSAGKSELVGDGLKHATTTTPAEFDLIAKDNGGNKVTRGGDKVQVKVTNPDGMPIDCKVKDNKDGTYTVTYNPADPGNHVVEVTLNRAQVAKSQYNVPISENLGLPSPSKSYAKGPGLEPGGKASDPQEFTIFAILPNGQPQKGGGSADLFDVHIEDPNGDLIPATIKDNRDGTYHVVYQPKDPGTYHVEVVERNPTNPLFYDHLKNSPIDVIIDPATDAAHSIAYGPGLEPGNFDTAETTFTIEARDRNDKPIKQGGDNFAVDIQGPTGPVPAKLVDNGDGTYSVAYSPKDAGPHDVVVTLDDIPIKGSTFHVDIKPGPWARNTFIKDYSFVVQTRDKRDHDIKEGGSEVAVEIKRGNAVVPADLRDNRDGTYTVHYVLKEKGDYKINVTVEGTSVKGSPFTQTVG